jgi:hypothetical protein
VPRWSCSLCDSHAGGPGRATSEPIARQQGGTDDDEVCGAGSRHQRRWLHQGRDGRPAPLVRCLGTRDVQTYLQSGNVLFSAPSDESARLAGDIQRRIGEDLAVTVTVLLRTRDDLDQVVANNPFLTRGANPATLHVTFLAATPDRERAARLDAPAGQPDEFALAGREAISPAQTATAGPN